MTPAVDLRRPEGLHPFFHVGILVSSLVTATEAFGALLGVDFEPVRQSQVACGDTVSYRYSLQGPPYLELIEMTGTGAFARAHGEGFHHLGIAQADLSERCAVLDRNGFRPEVMVRTPGGEPRVFFTDPHALHGVRLEHLALDVFGAIEARVREARG